MPIPLGGIAIKRSLADEIKKKVDRVIRRSVEYAFANPRSAYDFIKSNAQEMNEEVMYKHIELYVNKFSIDLGEEGKNAVDTMYKKAIQQGIIHHLADDIFVRI
jgi:1,4-dihydroxy-6-naphthoate synthase